MEKRYLFLLLILLNSNSFAQKKKSPELEVINFKSKFVSFYNNGANEDFGQEFKMIFFKDYIIFEQPIHHLKGSTFHVDSISVKDGDTTYHDNSAPDMTIVKVTYMYYVFKKGEKRGLFYDMDNNKSKPFSVDTLYIESNLGIENEADVSFDLGKPDEVKKRGKKWSEKYYNFKSESGRDTVFRYYDDALTNIPFSLSKKIDQEKKSKLIKSIEFIKYPQSFETKKLKPLRLEIINEIEVVTHKCSTAQLEKYQIFFEKYMLDSKTNKVNPY